MKKPPLKYRYLILVVVSVIAVASLAAGITHCYSSRSSAPQQASAPEENEEIPDDEAVAPALTAEEWADSVMATLSPRQRVAQLFVPRWDLPVSDATIQQQVVKEGIGGFLLGKAKLDAYVDVVNRAQAKAKVPLLSTLDGEWGLNMRVPDAPRFPKNIALGAIQNPELLEAYGREVARECKLAGIQVDFAPVLDVNSNPSNPVIGYRSFGEDPKRVAVLGAAFCKGMEEGGVMSVGKHFPGHGDTSVDSHKALPTVDHSKATMDAVDLLPFKAAAEAGMSGVMVGHLRVPALDKSGTPASLSKAITTELLREQLGFDGLIFTDALAMKGAATTGENNCVSAFKAGADIMLSSAAPVADIQAMCDAVKAGKISQTDIDLRCRKLLIYKYKLGLVTPQFVKKEGLARLINSPETKALLNSLAKASITVLSNRNNLLPLDSLAGRRITVVSLGSPANNEFAAICGKYTAVTSVAATSAAEVTKVLAEAKKADVVITGVFGADAWIKDAFAKLRNSSNFLPVFFINPFKMNSFSELSALPELITAYDDTPELQSAAAQALFGGIDVTGRFPVNIKGVASLGAGIDLKKKRLAYSKPGEVGMRGWLEHRVDSIVKKSIAGGAMPGCQILVAKDGNIIIDKSYGVLDKTGATQKNVSAATIYDLASMSKVCGTLSALMKTYDEGLWKLDDPVEKYIPETEGTPVGALTMQQLLYHKSGLPAGLNLFRLLLDPDTYTGDPFKYKQVAPYTVKIQKGVYGHRDAQLRRDLFSKEKSDTFPVQIARNLYAVPSVSDTIMSAIYGLTPKSDKSYVYSDLNFCLLRQVFDNITGEPLDDFLETNVFVPLDMMHTFYTPMDDYPIADIAPTETDNYLRRQHIQGFVHDETAAFSGGIQGNAGLFSNTSDIARLCQAWLDGGIYGGEQVFSPETVKLFTTSKASGCDRFLGFDNLVSKKDWGVSNRTFGHTGFTGTCLWIDPDNGIVYIFLSNRVNPSRDNAAFTKYNPRYSVMKEIYDAL